MKRASLFSALFCALLLIMMSGCGQTYELQSITLAGTSGTNGSGSVTGAFYDLVGEGGTLQLVATGNTSNGKSEDLSRRVTYSVVPMGNGNDIPMDRWGYPLPNPPQTVSITATGLLSATEPFTCTWMNFGTATQPSDVLTGSYKIVATYEGIVSNPVYVGVASAGPCPYPGSTPQVVDLPH